MKGLVIMNKMYPIFLKLENKKSLVIGGGNVAFRKITHLMESGSHITVISINFIDKILDLKNKYTNITLIHREFHQNDLKDHYIVFGCTNDPHINKTIFNECTKLDIPVNIADNPDNCSFYVPSVVSRGDLKIAVSTNGRCCSMTKKIRQELEEQYDEKYSQILIYLGILRDYLISHEPDENIRKNILTKIVNSSKLYKMFEKKINGETINPESELAKWK